MDDDDYNKDNDDNIDDCVDNGLDILQQLKHWAVTEKISVSSLSALLSILSQKFPEFPKDGRTLLNVEKCKKHNIIDVSNGQLLYIGIALSLEQLNWPDILEDTIYLSFGIDGKLDQVTQMVFKLIIYWFVFRYSYSFIY